uniref:Small ribosomal subunit protein mS25 n=1 Tax=Megafenestra aurita TaxID=2291010 RepID=A0A4Y7NHL4_9CRUS|nr:EOG090X0FQ5 [Megafenestra aurita]SVE92710.1 EOG090X0FQ5 [Megafenestra aurita]
MPFMRGPAPIRRTLEYLERNKLVLKDRVKIFSINYNTHGENHEGARQFVFWHLPQLQYKNPNIQIATFKNLTPSPFIRCYLENGEELLMDVDFKSKDEIYERIRKIICKSEEALHAEDKQENTANFGSGCQKHCICEVPGQIPCPSLVPLPNSWRGKYKFQKPDEL